MRPNKSLQKRGPCLPEELGPAEKARFFESLLENLSEGVYFVDKERGISCWNRAAERLTGYSKQEVVGRACFDNILNHVDEAGHCVCVDGCPLQDAMEDGKPREAELYLRHKQGHRVPISIRATPIRNSEGEIVGAVEVFSDASAKRRVERRAGELEILAYRDPLTGVANRRYTEMRLQQLIQDVREFGRGVGLIVMDLDNFKTVNDTWGHQTGDGVLCEISKTLVASLRPADIVGRWGGEEFLVILLDANTALLQKVAQRCRVMIEASRFPLFDRWIRVTASLGATLISPADSLQSLIARADSLMYKSKSAGRNAITLDPGTVLLSKP